MPGTKWWMWRRPIRTLKSSGTPRRTPKVVSRTALDEITNADSRLNSTVSPVAASLVAAARHLDRVERRAGALLDHLGRGLRLLGDDPPAPQPADLAGRHRAHRAERDDAHHERALLEAVEPSQAAAAPDRRNCAGPRGSAQQVRLGDLAHRRARARPSRPRAAARRASRPRRRRRTPPRRSRRRAQHGAAADPAARPMRGPRSGSSGGLAAHRVVVGGDDPGPDEHVVLDHRVGREVAVGLDPHAGADRDVVVDARCRGRSRLPSPIVDALAHLRLVADDRTLARSAPRRRRPRPRRPTRPRSSTSGSSGSRGAVELRAEARALAEHGAVLDLAAVADHGAAVDHDATRRARASSPSSTSCPSISPGARSEGCTQCFTRRAAAGSRRCGTPPASSERCSASSTRTARRPLAGAGARLAPVAHALDEVPALDPQRLLVRDLRAHHVPERVMYSP